MNHPLKRFLICIVVPPFIGSLVFAIAFAIEALQLGRFLQALGAILFVYLYAIVICFIPGSLFFISHEAIAKMGRGSFHHKPRYIGIGAILGSICGLGIGSLMGLQALVIFVPLGSIAGAVTAWINFPPNNANPT